MPESGGSDTRDMREQSREARCRRAMAVECGIAGAGRAWGVVNANRITLHPGHIIFAIGGGGGVARCKGKTTLHPHIVRNDGRAVGLIQKGNTIFGPGAAAGTFAIAFRSIGFVGKLLAEALEEISPGPLEALNATGTPASHVLLKGAWPQIAPAFWGGGNNSQGHPYPR